MVELLVLIVVVDLDGPMNDGFEMEDGGWLLRGC